MEEIDFSRKKSGNHEKFGKMKLNFGAKKLKKITVILVQKIQFESLR